MVFFLRAIQKSLLEIYRGSKPGSATRKKDQGTQENNTEMLDKSEGQKKVILNTMIHTDKHNSTSLTSKSAWKKKSGKSSISP